MKQKKQPRQVAFRGEDRARTDDLLAASQTL